MFNFTHDRIGFNGDYWQVSFNPGEQPEKKQASDEPENPLIFIIIIAGSILLVLITVCIYIKIKNNKLKEILEN